MGFTFRILPILRWIQHWNGQPFTFSLRCNEVITKKLYQIIFFLQQYLICVRNGGGSFLIPFVIAMFLVGMPLFYLEVLIGQFSGRSPLTLWGHFCPAFKGVGFAMTLVSFGTLFYYMPFTWSSIYVGLFILASN